MTNSLLPSNESTLLKQKDIAYRSAIPNHADIINFDPMTCDAKLLPYLAQVWQVLYWDKEWSELEKRRFVRDAREVHKHIGTPHALMKMFEALDIDAKLIEWYEYGGQPYHFSLDLSLENKEITLDMATRLRKYVEVYKNVRTVLEEIRLSYVAKGQTNIALLCVPEIEVYLAAVETYEQSVFSQINIALLCVPEIEVNLEMVEV